MLETIKLGKTGDTVKVAQYLMNYAERKKASGEFNEAFKKFVINWQKNKNLVADGIIGKNTWTTLANTLPTCSTSKNKKSSYTCGLQLLLGGIEADGVFGTKTKNAVAAYQSANKLSVDGVCGPKTWKSLIIGVAETTEGQTISGDLIMNNCVKYLQWDSKWKKVKYSTHTSSQTIGNSGCGPTSMAQIMATFIDPSITPVEMCELAVKNGYRTYSNGTSWSFYKFVFKKYDGFSKYIETGNIETLKSALKNGALAVCSMNNKDDKFWTSQGHFITVRGYDNKYIYANDPNKEETPRKQEISKFKTCMKQAFIFWPKKKEVSPTPEKPTTPPQDDRRFDINLNGKIIDISKWQGNIDFTALKKEVGLVIVRASCGSDKDTKFDEYAKAMIENRIPFGVYCYSYAGTVEKAKDEAKKLVSYAEKYDPLFYVMDAEEAKITNDAIKAFAQELRANTSERIGCYVANHRYKAYGYDKVKDLFDFTWIPSYGKNDGTIEGSKKPSYDCDLWQYTSVGKIAGIGGNVDMNTILNSKKDLKWLIDG